MSHKILVRIGNGITYVIALAILSAIGLQMAETFGPSQTCSGPTLTDRWIWYPAASICGYSAKDAMGLKASILGSRVCMDGSIAPDEWTQKIRNQKFASEQQSLLGNLHRNAAPMIEYSPLTPRPRDFSSLTVR